jgi:hypothetical protein
VIPRARAAARRVTRERVARCERETDDEQTGVDNAHARRRGRGDIVIATSARQECQTAGLRRFAESGCTQVNARRTKTRENGTS